MAVPGVNRTWITEVPLQGTAHRRTYTQAVGLGYDDDAPPGLGYGRPTAHRAEANGAQGSGRGVPRSARRVELNAAQANVAPAISLRSARTVAVNGAPVSGPGSARRVELNVAQANGLGIVPRHVGALKGHRNTA